MQPQNTQQTPKSATSSSSKPSITGGVFAIMALASSGIANFLVHSDARSHTEVTTAVGKVDSGPVADVASKSIAAVLSVPFSIGGLLLASIALIFTLIRLRKVKSTGLAFSLIWIVISIWAIAVAIGAFDAIRAQPAN